jgi:hypothetical protein
MKAVDESASPQPRRGDIATQISKHPKKRVYIARLSGFSKRIMLNLRTLRPSQIDRNLG